MKILKIGIVGTPNSGKSSLINYITGSNFIVSHRPHSTKEIILSVLKKENKQLVFLDTPGITPSKNKELKTLNGKTESLMKNCDLLIFLFDSTKPLDKYGIYSSHYANNKIAILTKTDLVSKGRLLPLTDQLQSQFKEIFYTSVIDGSGINHLIEYLFDNTINSSTSKQKEEVIIYRPLENQIKDRIKEVLFDNLLEEVPYQIDIKINVDSENKIIDCLLLARQAHHHIIISKIKTLSVSMREKINKMLKRKYSFFLKVKEK